jgi:hypothetical protein
MDVVIRHAQHTANKHSRDNAFQEESGAVGLEAVNSAHLFAAFGRQLPDPIKSRVRPSPAGRDRPVWRSQKNASLSAFSLNALIDSSRSTQKIKGPLPPSARRAFPIGCLGGAHAIGVGIAPQLDQGQRLGMLGLNDSHFGIAPAEAPIARCRRASPRLLVRSAPSPCPAFFRSAARRHKEPPPNSRSTGPRVHGSGSNSTRLCSRCAVSGRFQAGSFRVQPAESVKGCPMRSIPGVDPKPTVTIVGFAASKLRLLRCGGWYLASGSRQETCGCAYNRNDKRATQNQ